MAEILFIRILEACNAGCVMCGFAFSRDSYRFGKAEIETALPRLWREGVRVVRFTGGEPLMHRAITDLIRSVAEAGMSTSVITNGMLLPKLLGQLQDAGLSQVIVSIDAADPRVHDTIRRQPGLYERATSGLRDAVAAGLKTRVNTVCGPSNFREMPALQDLLTAWRIDQWELSSLKLERRLDYTESDMRDVPAVVAYVYREAVAARRLLPMGKVWCGESDDEQDRYFRLGVTPRPSRICHVVRHVRYLDARQAALYPCSLLPHRKNANTAACPVDLSDLQSMTPEIEILADHFSREGPTVCTGCSSTAASFSDSIDGGAEFDQWRY